MELKIIDGLFQTRGVDAEKRSVDAVMSTDALDRYKERIPHASWEKRLSRFQASPVLLKDHDHTKPIGHWKNVKVTDKGLIGTAVFATTPDAEERFVLHRDGHVNSFSVGFIPHKWAFADEVIDGKPTRVRVYEDNELLECSSVAVGANHEAIQRLMRSLAHEGDPANFDKRVEAAVERKMKELMHAGPGGLMTTMALDVADIVAARLGLGVDDPYGDIDDDPGSDAGNDPATGEENNELKAALQGVLGR